MKISKIIVLILAITAAMAYKLGKKKAVSRNTKNPNKLAMAYAAKNMLNPKKNKAAIVFNSLLGVGILSKISNTLVYKNIIEWNWLKKTTDFMYTPLWNAESKALAA